MGCEEKFIVGRTPGFRRTTVALPATTHAIMLAPPGTGKTTTLIHGLLTYAGGVVVTDPKGEIYEHTAWFRSEILGQAVHYWSASAPRAPLPVGNLYGGNVKALEAFRDVYTRQTGTDPAFLNPWVGVLTALIKDAEHRGEPPWQTALAVPVADWGPALKEIAAEPDNPAREDARQVLRILERGERYLASAEGTVMNLHGALRRLAPALDAPSEPLEFGDLTVYLAFEEGADAEGVITVWILEGLYQAFMQARAERNPYGVRWVIDEAGVLRPNLLPNMLRIGRGRGAGVIAVAQSGADLVEAYGQAGASALYGALNGPLIIFGVHRGDRETLAYLTRVLEPYVQVYHRPDEQLRPTRAQAAGEILARLRTGLMIPPDSNPVRLQPYPWFRNRKVRQRVELVDPPRELRRTLVHPRPLKREEVRGEELDLGDI